MKSFEVWKDKEGLTGVCDAGTEGDAFRKEFGDGAILIHSIEAKSNFDLMNQYYAFMDWGKYESDYPELDNKPFI